MRGVAFTRLSRIAVPKGDVLHGLKLSDVGYAGFGEAYFTSVEHGAVKGWRRHRSMVLNLIVPVGAVRFVAVQDGDEEGRGEVFEISDQPDAYGRLTVSPGVWLAFQGIRRELNLILNIASVPHDPEESDTRRLEEIAWDWSL